MTFRAINVVDCEVVEIEKELVRAAEEEWAQVRAILEIERERDLNAKLTKSVDLFKDGKIPDSAPVLWDGKETTWGSLSGNERMCCELNARGVLEGGNRF